MLNHFCSHPVVHTLEVLTKVRSTICGHRMDGNELVHREIRFVTLALLPLTQVGCGPRGLAKLELGDCKLEKEQDILQMTSSCLSLRFWGQCDPRFLMTSLLPKIASCLRWSTPLQNVEISWAKCLSSSASWWLRAGHWEVGTSESVSYHCHLFAIWSWAGCLTSLNFISLCLKRGWRQHLLCRGFKWEKALGFSTVFWPVIRCSFSGGSSL